MLGHDCHAALGVSGYEPLDKAVVIVDGATVMRILEERRHERRLGDEPLENADKNGVTGQPRDQDVELSHEADIFPPVPSLVRGVL